MNPPILVTNNALKLGPEKLYFKAMLCNTYLLLTFFFVSHLGAQIDTSFNSKDTKIGAINTLLTEVFQHLKTPYRSGGKNPKGFDCSGFVAYCYNRTLGIRTPPSSSLFYNQGVHVNKSQARPGDIICFTGYNANRRIMGHVGIITEVSPTEIFFIHSAVKGGIKIDAVSSTYYRLRFMDIRRFF
ncbi:MAG: glycoside hydrolase [Flavobacteriales bacterium]|nr:MAG: glycoside hydrolase [Flavobacteriales bacterium]